MTKLVNRAKMTTATTGTGTITLGSAVDGYQTFANAGVANADVMRYVIEDGDAWEIGLGTYTASGTTLTRGSIESSTGTALNLTGNAVVFVSAAAGDLQELVDFADNFTLPTADGTTGQVLTTNGSGTLSFTSPGASLAGQTDSASPFETSLGFEAGLNTTGVNNTFVGYQAGKENTTGANNTAVGYRALDTATTGSDNVAVGFQTLVRVSTETKNTAVGYRALRNAVGSDSTAVGYNAGAGAAALFGAASQSLFGAFAGEFANTTETVAVGHQALRASSSLALTGTSNIGIGSQAGFSLSTGLRNFLGGSQAGLSLTTGSFNVAIGNGALDAATTGGRNIAIGQDAMGLGVATAATGDNIAIGFQAGYKITSASNAVFIGERAGENLTTGGNNIGIGYRSMAGSTAGFTGASNVGVGFECGQGLTNGGSNSILGHAAGTFLSTGSNNVIAGALAGYNVTTGSENVIIGRNAAFSGTNNLTTGVNNIIVGDSATASSATVSNEITLGNSSITTLRCQVTTITSLSDARDKTDIQPLNAGLEFVEALNPVSFTWNMRDGGKVGEADTGFIAQDLQAAQADIGVTIPGLVFDANPEKLEAGYGKLIPVLVQAIKDLSAKVNELEARLEDKE
jgi:hypothetical protein